MTTLPDILTRCDAGQHPDEIAGALGISTGRVYAVLREHRPSRKRKPRACKSELQYKIRGLKQCGIKPSRIAFLLGCTRAHVYKTLSSSSDVEG